MRFPATLVRVSEEAVKRGANRLDQRRPNWYKQITCKTLDLSSSCDCVIGQLYGKYDANFLRRVLNNVLRRTVYDAAATHGFCISDEAVVWAGEAPAYNNAAYNRRWDAAYNLLDRLWIAEIKKRRDRDAAAEAQHGTSLTQVAA